MRESEQQFSNLPDSPPQILP